MLNQLKTFAYLAVLSLLLILFGDLVANESGVFVMFVLVILMLINAIIYASKIILTMVNAKRVADNDSTDFLQLVAELAKRAKIPVPAIFVIDAEPPNAFSVGRTPKKSAIVITSGLLKLENKSLQSSALAYAMISIKHRYTLLNDATAYIAFSIFTIFSVDGWKSVFGAKTNFNDESPTRIGKVIFAPVSAALIKVVVPIMRVFDIDREAALLVGDSTQYVEAIRQMESQHQTAPFPEANLHPSIAHLFVINPIRNPRFSELFNRFPTVDARVNHLKNVQQVPLPR